MYKVILGSNSPRREEILKQAGVSFTIIPSTKDEKTTKVLPMEIVEELALNKAIDVAEEINETSIIIGADTMVAIGNEVLGKPHNYQEALRMLTLLQGKEHQVYTGVGIIIKNVINKVITEKTISFSQVSLVRVSDMAEEQIKAYIDTNEPFDKAGAYGIQGKFGVHIEGITGEYNNIVGLPIAKIYRSLLEEGIDLLSL
ncbi:MAG: maf protein [Anaerocolumna sp.]|jgi:septum formation protein|nr:maf protein [Anaerocolumna sp.]